MNPSQPATDWRESPAHLFLLTLFLDPRPVEDISTLLRWESVLGESLTQAIDRLRTADVLAEVDPDGYLSSTHTVPELKQMLRDRGLKVSGRKDELAARLVESNPAEWSALGCSEQGAAIATECVAERNANGDPVSLDEKPPEDEPLACYEWLRSELQAGIVGSASWDTLDNLTKLIAASPVCEADLPEAAPPADVEDVAVDGPIAPEEDIPEELDAQSYLDRAQQLLAAGEFIPAIAEYSAAIERDPEQSAAYNGRGWAHYKLGRYKYAMADYNRTIELDDACAAAYIYRGKVYNKLGDYEKAIEEHSTAIRLVPDYAIAYCNRGTVYNNLDDMMQAIADFDEAIRLDPSYVTAYNNRGNAYYKQKLYEEALVDYNRAIDRDSSYGIAYFNRGNAYYESGQRELASADYRASIALLDQLVETNPECAENHFNRGLAHQYLKEYSQARDDYLRALELLDASDTPLKKEVKSRVAKLRVPFLRRFWA